ncbi:hypothetical protein BDR06DRAFT_1046725 [Suillus hirtellus]|nr:hypothetical protein BDR06DRAFT_1046725 [Suillus hirtellus]
MRIDVVGDFSYETFKTPRVCEEMVMAMSHMRRLFKMYAMHNIQDVLHLWLPPAERAITVKAHFSGLEFLHKVIIAPQFTTLSKCFMKACCIRMFGISAFLGVILIFHLFKMDLHQSHESTSQVISVFVLQMWKGTNLNNIPDGVELQYVSMCCMKATVTKRNKPGQLSDMMAWVYSSIPA